MTPEPDISDVRSKAEHRFDNDLRYREGEHPNQTQLTPAYVLEPIRIALGGHIGLDPCTEPDNPTRALTFYTPPQDGRIKPWPGDSIYVNPPYGKAREQWVRRCIEAGAHGRRVVLLIPAATDTAIFQQAIECATTVVFTKGRIKFGAMRPNRRWLAASHPSALIGWNVDLGPCAHLGAVVKPVQTRLTLAAMPEVERLRDALTAAALGEPGWRERAMRLVGIDPDTGEQTAMALAPPSDRTALPSK